MQPEIVPTAQPTSSPGSGERSLFSLITALANAVRALHHQERRGDLASLRRMDADEPVPPAFQRILVRAAPDADLNHARRIALFVKILSLPMGGDALAADRRRLGEAMADDGISEKRVQMLMTARGPALDDLLLRTARRLARAGVLPFQEIGELILGDPTIRERTRFAVAKAYWAGRARRDDAGTAAPPENENRAGARP